MSGMEVISVHGIKHAYLPFRDEQVEFVTCAMQDK